jgi:hypothetical protein
MGWPSSSGTFPPDGTRADASAQRSPVDRKVFGARTQYFSGHEFFGNSWMRAHCEALKHLNY